MQLPVPLKQMIFENYDRSYPHFQLWVERTGFIPPPMHINFPDKPYLFISIGWINLTCFVSYTTALRAQKEAEEAERRKQEEEMLKAMEEEERMEYLRRKAEEERLRAIAEEEARYGNVKKRHKLYTIVYM